MIAYHFCWDLGYFGFIDLRLITQGFGLFIAQLIGSCFITIAGISSRIMSLSDSFKQKFLKQFNHVYSPNFINSKNVSNVPPFLMWRLRGDPFNDFFEDSD